MICLTSAKISIIPDYAKYFGKKLSSGIVGNGTRSKVGQGLPNEQGKSCSLFALCYVESTSNLRRTYVESTSKLHRSYIEPTSNLRRIYARKTSTLFRCRERVCSTAA